MIVNEQRFKKNINYTVAKQYKLYSPMQIKRLKTSPTRTRQGYERARERKVRV